VPFAADIPTAARSKPHSFDAIAKFLNDDKNSPACKHVGMLGRIDVNQADRRSISGQRKKGLSMQQKVHNPAIQF
jgi:hypothetical protein